MKVNRIKKVVVVYGDQNSGKTDSLCRLCKLLIAKCSGRFVLRKAGGAAQQSVLPLNKKSGKYQDVLFAATVKGAAGNDVTVGVGTAGDTWDAVWRNFMFFDEVLPDHQFDVVFVAIREQPRKDGLCKSEHSFPLLALEELECNYGIDCVQRPFERTTVVQKGYGGSQMAFQKQCQSVNRQFANKLMGMI